MQVLQKNEGSQPIVIDNNWLILIVGATQGKGRYKRVYTVHMGTEFTTFNSAPNPYSSCSLNSVIDQ